MKKLGKSSKSGNKDPKQKNLKAQFNQPVKGQKIIKSVPRGR